MDYKQTFSKRLKSAREMRGLSMAGLSAELGNSVTPQAIYKYESGKMLPGSPLLVDLSRVLQVPADYFFRPFAVNISGIEFRKKSKLKVHDRKAIEGIAVDKVERYVEIEDICGCQQDVLFKKHEAPVASNDDVIDLVWQLRQTWGIGSNRIQNVIRFLESLGVIVVEIDASEAFDGLSGYADDFPVIVINKGFPSERKRFTALHELGHLIMSFPDEADSRKHEALCNLFANELLYPSSVFKESASDLFKGKISLQDLADIQKEFGISIDAIMYKAWLSGIVSDSRMRNYHVLKNSRPAFKNYAETSRIPDETSDRFERLVYQAANGELISMSKAASLLDMPVESFMQRSFVI